MKLFCILSAEDYRPSSRFRLVQHLPVLRDHGISVEIAVAKRQNLRDILRMWRSSHRSDCVLIQKKLFAGWKLHLLGDASPLIFDMDDAYFATSPFEVESHGHRKARRRTLQREERLRVVLERSSRVIVGNNYLADYARTVTRDVVVLPTAVDLSKFPRQRVEDRDNGGMTVGWIGSRPSLRYLEGLREPLTRICARFENVRVVQICDSFASLEGVACERVRWSLGREAEHLSNLDIGLMPLQDDSFSRGKCALKMLQYFAAGAAVVCSPVGANLEVARDQETALFATNLDQWEENISRLLEQPTLRRAMRQRARETVEKHYAADVIGARLAEIISSTLLRKEDRVA